MRDLVPTLSDHDSDNDQNDSSLGLNENAEDLVVASFDFCPNDSIASLLKNQEDDATRHQNEKNSKKVKTGALSHVWDFDAVKRTVKERPAHYTTLEEKIHKHSQKKPQQSLENDEQEGDNEENSDLSEVAFSENESDGDTAFVEAEDDDDDEMTEQDETFSQKDNDEQNIVTEFASEQSDMENEMSDIEDVEQEMNAGNSTDLSDGDDLDEKQDTVLEKKKLDFFAPIDKENDEVIYESFTEMNLSRPVLKALTEVGFLQPTRIQSMTVPIALNGKDICGGAVTGSGKTAAFLIPILERLMYRPRSNAVTRVLILTPTRELAAQCFSVAKKLAQYTDITFCLCVGGTSNAVQEAELRLNPDVVIATPGRLIDHLQNSAHFGLDAIEILVMDEADRMLDEGFQVELTEIIKACPKKRQTLLFSATMTDNVDQLIHLSMNRPVRLFVDPTRTVAYSLIQEFIRVRLPSQNPQEEQLLRESLVLTLCKRTYKERAIIFVPSKVQAHRLLILFQSFNLSAVELHGNMSQRDRIDALEKFRDGIASFMIATDVAARGLDLPDVQTVINFSLPTAFDRYVHRVGRTARNKRSGKAVSLVGEKERKMVKIILKNLKEGQSVRQRIVPVEVIKKYRARIIRKLSMIENVLTEEKEERMIQHEEMKVTKAENLIMHAEKIHSRPAKTYIDKKAAAKSLEQNKQGEEESKEKAKDDLYSISKAPKRSALSGLTRKQKRRKIFNSEDAKELKKVQASQKAAARQAKRSVNVLKTEGKRPGELKKNAKAKKKAAKKFSKNTFAADMSQKKKSK